MNQAYNERLFGRNDLRSKLHFSRYYWLKEKILKHCPDVKSVLELGCFDGKALNFLPFTPEYYQGYDANWENGLEIGREEWASNANFHFVFCDKIEDFNPEGEGFDISICMETMEHLPLSDLEKYISRLSKATKQYCFVTVPNEKGAICVLKYFSKKILYKRTPEPYSGKDLLNAFLGNMSKIKRIEGGHKGFDYLELVELLKHYFKTIEVEGIPFKRIPINLNFTVGIILKK
jgi:SAM-dependent methyltransferase